MGHAGVAALLLEAKPEIASAVDDGDYTALHWALNDHVADVLLRAQPGLINGVTRAGWTPLHCAASRPQHDAKLIRVLLNARPQLGPAVTNEDRTALHLAALQGHDSRVTTLFEANPELIGAVDGLGLTPLSYIVNFWRPNVLNVIQDRVSFGQLLDALVMSSRIEHAERLVAAHCMSLLTDLQSRDIVKIVYDYLTSRKESSSSILQRQEAILTGRNKPKQEKEYTKKQ